MRSSNYTRTSYLMALFTERYNSKRQFRRSRVKALSTPRESRVKSRNAGKKREKDALQFQLLRTFRRDVICRRF